MKSRIQKKQKRKIYSLFMIFLSLFLIILLIRLFPQNAGSIIPVTSLQNFVKAEISIMPQTIILRTGCYELDMVTTNEQIESISITLTNVTYPRPNAHDLIGYILKNFEISFLFVKIHSLDEGTYFANILLKKGNQILVLDSRPSDAVAIALRSNVPIYVNSSLLQYARKVC